MNKNFLYFIGLAIVTAGIAFYYPNGLPSDSGVVIEPTDESSANIMLGVGKDEIINSIVSEMNTKEKPIQVLEEGVPPSDKTDTLVTPLPKGTRVDTYGDYGYIIVLTFPDREEEHYYDTKKGFIKTNIWYYEEASTTP